MVILIRRDRKETHRQTLLRSTYSIDLHIDSPLISGLYTLICFSLLIQVITYSLLFSVNIIDAFYRLGNRDFPAASLQRNSQRGEVNNFTKHREYNKLSSNSHDIMSSLSKTLTSVFEVFVQVSRTLLLIVEMAGSRASCRI